MGRVCVPGLTSAISESPQYADDFTPMSTTAPLGSKETTLPVTVSPREYFLISPTDAARSS
jgi:hypothetical protein